MEPSGLRYVTPLRHSKHKVVGVVVNAVDDRLRTAQQIRDTWTIEAIRPLGASASRPRGGAYRHPDE